MDIIRFEQVTKVYRKDFVALSDINLVIKEGEFVSLVGPSGAGKSTLLKLIYAEEMPTNGTVYFEDTPIDSISRRKLPFYRRKIGTVFQDSKLLPHKTVFENVAYALEMSGVSNEQIQEDVPQILAIVGLESKANMFPSELSGGEQQRVAMARALIHKPKVILADEPTGNLDPTASMEILKLLLGINKLGATIILASHDKDVVNKAGKRMLVMDGGRIIRDEAVGKYKIV